LISEFSTTGPVARTVSEIVLMDVVQSYFTYEVWTDCGIPSLTLDGTVEDWKKLRSKAEQLKTYGDLDWWIDQVLPILDQFVAAASGQVDGDFWKSMYKYQSGSGSMYADGWFLKLLPYAKIRRETKRNPVLTGERTGLEASELPASVSSVPFLFDGVKYQFLAGHTATVQEKDGTLRPALGWAVRPEPAK